MKLRLLSNLLLFCTSVALYASVPVVMTDSLPDSFDSEACEAVMQSSSACNQGAEAFSKFIAQFNSSLKFRAIRMKCDSRSNDYTLMTWTKVEADSVWMVGGYMPPGDNSDRGINAVYFFRRISGKWYLVDGFIEDHAA